MRCLTGAGCVARATRRRSVTMGCRVDGVTSQDRPGGDGWRHRSSRPDSPGWGSLRDRARCHWHCDPRKGMGPCETPGHPGGPVVSSSSPSGYVGGDDAGGATTWGWRTRVGQRKSPRRRGGWRRPSPLALVNLAAVLTGAQRTASRPMLRLVDGIVLADLCTARLVALRDMSVRAMSDSGHEGTGRSHAAPTLSARSRAQAAQTAGALH